MQLEELKLANGSAGGNVDAAVPQVDGKEHSNIQSTEKWQEYQVELLEKLNGSEQFVEYLLLTWVTLLSRWSAGTETVPTWSFVPSDGSNKMSGAVTDVVATGNESIVQALEALRAKNITLQDESTSFQLLTDAQNAAVLSAEWGIEARVSGSRVYMRNASSLTSLPPRALTIVLDTFLDLLEALVSDSTQTLPQSTTLGSRELSQLWQWNTPVPPIISTPTHKYISEWAEKDPSRPAVLSWDGEFTYGEIESLSTQLAVRLATQHNIGVGSTVPLCFEKSSWTVIGVIAIMKTGACFVLTDPHQPEARLRTIAEEVNATVVLTSASQAELGEKFKPAAATLIIVGPGLRDEQVENIDTSVLPADIPGDSPLYTIFTSGSTGKPKGVVISHTNYTSGAIPRAEAVGYKPHSRVLDFASYAFDVSIDCMLCTLSHGGCICVPSDDQRVNDLSGAIRGMRVNMAHMTPSVARVLDPDILPSLEVIGLGGEAVSARDADAWNRLTNVVIAYGPSECTVGCTINNDIGEGKTYTSIGKGVGGSTWIVDADDHDVLTPIGGVGELLVEGPVVGLGYLNEPGKTKEVFIEDPAWLLAGANGFEARHGRLYKTGDLVRYDPDGSGDIVFVGRKDRQVKLRGQRVELAEIEHHLRHLLPAGTSVVVEVITPGSKSAEPTLVAFVAEQKEKENHQDDINTPIVALSSELQTVLAGMDKQLAAHLPTYMVPTAYIPLREIPLLVSCKTDRKRLHEIGLAMSKQQLAKFRVQTVEKTAPRTEMELRIHALWTKLFGSDLEIGIEDNFFALGGDSLRAMKLVAAARIDSLSLTVAQIFTNPTLEGMATVATTESEGSSEIPPFSLLGDWEADKAREEVAKLCNLDPALVEDVYKCTPLQEGLMALSAKVSEAYIASRVVELKDLETAKKLQVAFEAAHVDCPILRTRIVQVVGRGLVQVVVNEKITWHTSNCVEEYVTKAQATPMELGEPLARFGLVEDEKTSKVHLVLTIHHALYDGWSMPLVVDRVNNAYRGLPTDLRAPFKAFIRYLDGMNRTDAENYWRSQLDGASGLQFPVLPKTGYQQQADSLLEEYITLPQSAKSSTTLATAIRGAWAVVAAQYIGSNDVVFGETLTGRNAPVPGVELIEGPMITTVPMRVRLDPETRISDFLQSIHEQTVDRIPHEHMGLQHIRRLSPDAKEACELRTGLVLHPTIEEDPNAPTEEECPANKFVPAGDEEAASEALKFNSYGLMLVCSLDPKGFLVMASFDSKMVQVPHMQRALEQFSKVVKLFVDDTSGKIGDVEVLEESDRELLWRLSEEGTKSVKENGKEVLGENAENVTAAWIVDQVDQHLLPAGAVGELAIETSAELGLPAIENPSWLSAGSKDVEGRQARVYQTGQLVKFTPDGSIVFMGKKGELGRPPAPIKKQSSGTSNATLTEKQKKVLKIWSRILMMEEQDIGLTDSFFELGGDSIAAMKLVSECRMEGFKLTVAQIFSHRRLVDMSEIIEELEPTREVVKEAAPATPFSLLDIPSTDKFIEEAVRPALANKDWKIQDILPTRQLQEIAVQGTIQLPRYSSRYELFYFDKPVDRPHLFNSCQELIARNEMLRTIFISHDTNTYGVVLETLIADIVEYSIEGDLETFCQNLCNLDVQTSLPHGSAFVKFFFVLSTDSGRSCLLFRISHSQYDEICLPLILRQLSALYENRPVVDTLPFSGFVHHVLRENVPQSIPYWRDLLKGSSMTLLRPDIPLKDKKSLFIQKPVDISARSKDITVATLPTAAWALTLARRFGSRDVVFGEVVTGRNTGLPNADNIMGPCWQYIPHRAMLSEDMTGLDLLTAVQQQHISSTPYEGIGLAEITKLCVQDEPGWKGIEWYDTVVHQDVAHVEELEFGEAVGKMETVYPHLEPLREWKFQAFASTDGKEMVLEIVTFTEWESVAREVLEEVAQAMEQLVERPGEKLL
ncbi:putative nonribosomal peptide synthase SidD [Ascodesmis nigricans]|uniref:Putative nonribosomal peptide synthase SidD n=1 Tax=Ascodesmis nigricans TaxID=341454 RepID=A0A4S2MU44_9PEZI|nr:putative nonribosomal peptide synthase SidD [Ascodesmis nigricans]